MQKLVKVRDWRDLIVIQFCKRNNEETDCLDIYLKIYRSAVIVIIRKW